MTPAPNDLIDTVAAIGREVAHQHANSVDTEARFPKETLAALKHAGALGAAVPKEFGGPGCNIVELTQMTQALSEHCAASGMVLAMHHIQVASIANHLGGSSELGDYLGRVASEQRLIASATSEIGPSGDMRRSECAVTPTGDDFEVTKQATTISYGQHADDLLLTARRNADAAPNDQVAVLALQGSYIIEIKGVWNTLGMRGTCSPGGEVRVSGAPWQIMSQPFGDIATETMVPYSHITWAGCWLGIATDAVNKARKSVREAARKQAGQTPPAALNLAATMEKLIRLRAEVYGAAREQDHLAQADRPALSSLGYALRINSLKLSASTQVPEIITDALRIIGIRAYKNDSEYALGRHLRDAHSAALMVNNDRLRATNASLLLVHKGN
tara:strand:+ start:11286 stop:12446 length:1161 start_codon:yes stop_codon:yes gene_type:complete